VQIVRATILVLAAAAGLPAPAAAQNTLYAECPEIGGLDLFMKNMSVQTELKLTARQVVKAQQVVSQAQFKYQKEYQALLQLQDRPKEYEARSKKLMKAVADDQVKGLGLVLKSAQMKRLKEIGYQIAVFEALNNAEVQKKLDLTTKQQDDLKAIKDDYASKRESLIKQKFGNDKFDEFKKEWIALRDETRKKSLAVLTAAQKKTWDKMTGKPFEYTPHLFLGMGIYK
jgi:hypothetical protein